MNYKKLLLVTQKTVFSLSVFASSFLFITALLILMGSLSYQPSSMLAQLTSSDSSNTNYSSSLNPDRIEVSNHPVQIEPPVIEDVDTPPIVSLFPAEASPEIKVTGDIPVETKNSFSINLETVGIIKVTARVLSSSNSFTKIITGKKLDDNHFIVQVPAITYPAGQYGIYITGNSSSGLVKTISNLTFVVPAPPVVPIVVPSLITTPTTSAVTEFSANVILEAQNIYEAKVPVAFTTSKEAKAIRVYLVDSNNQKRYLGLAQRDSSLNWSYLIDTTQMSNSAYSLGATISLDDTEYELNKLYFPIYNPPPAEKVEIIDDVLKAPAVDYVVPSLPTTVSTPVTPAVPSVAPVVPVSQTNTVSPVTTSKAPPKQKVVEPNISLKLKPDLNQITAQVLKDRMLSINAQIKTYTDTIEKSGATSTPAFLQTRVAIMNDILSDRGLVSISPEAKQRIELEITKLIARAERVELALYAERNKLIKPEDLLTSLTNEAEIVAEDSLIDYTSPREFGLVREDILTIDTVKPIVTSDISDSGTTTQAEIRGKAIPNSIVTLYIYSDPVMVTVKADAEGNFVYVYDQELEDGEHEIYVAITSNSGSVVVKSEGFGFIKQAEAFTVNNEPSAASITVAATNTNPFTNPYLIVLAMSVMAFSITILLLSRRLDPELEMADEVANNIHVQ